MADDADRLRARIEEQRSEITGTVRQIENRVRPGRIVARRRARIRRTLTDWRDVVFGNDEPDYPTGWYQYGWASTPNRSRAYQQQRRSDPYGRVRTDQRGDDGGPYDDGDGRMSHVSDRAHGAVDRVSDTASDLASSARDTAREAPTMVRRQTRGNPLAAGAIALGVGWLASSLLPATERERHLARQLEPKLADAAASAKDEARSLADEMREPARDAAEHVKETGREAAGDLRDDAKEAAGSVRQQASGNTDGR
jgi:ElaB/YqjD/DUF883 family membrane-anchored ribosome-binding protein